MRWEVSRDNTVKVTLSDEDLVSIIRGATRGHSVELFPPPGAEDPLVPGPKMFFMLQREGD